MSNPDNDKIFCEIREILESNGSISRETRDRLLLAAMSELYSRVGRVETLLDDFSPWMKLTRYAVVTIGTALLVLVGLFITGRAEIIIK